jgi:hypothetical protein
LLSTCGVEAFALKGNGWCIPLTYHRYVAVKAGWLTWFLVDAAFNS